MGQTSPVQRELDEIEVLTDWVRSEIYSLRAGGRRVAGTTAIAAAAAEESYRIIDKLPSWRNETSDSWREHLARVWAFLAGDSAEHYPLSHAVAAYLVSPLNHNDGQDGPDDFDRPQTVAAYSAVLSVVVWGVDFAVTAIMQIFDCIDLKHQGEYSDARDDDVQQEVSFVHRVVEAVTGALRSNTKQLPAKLLDAIIGEINDG